MGVIGYGSAENIPRSLKPKAKPLKSFKPNKYSGINAGNKDDVEPFCRDTQGNASNIHHYAESVTDKKQCNYPDASSDYRSALPNPSFAINNNMSVSNDKSVLKRNNGINTLKAGVWER